jgi:hypothetical protein
MTNPFPAETPDPNIDNPVPTDGPATVPEQEPPRHHATTEEPPKTMPPVIVVPE